MFLSTYHYYNIQILISSFSASLCRLLSYIQNILLPFPLPRPMLSHPCTTAYISHVSPCALAGSKVDQAFDPFRYLHIIVSLHPRAKSSLGRRLWWSPNQTRTAFLWGMVHAGGIPAKEYIKNHVMLTTLFPCQWPWVGKG